MTDPRTDLSRPEAGGLPPWMTRAREAAAAALTAERIGVIVEKQAQKAEEGDLKAAKFCLDLMGKLTPPKVEFHQHYHESPPGAAPAALPAPPPAAHRTPPATGSLLGRIHRELREHGAATDGQLAARLSEAPDKILAALQADPDCEPLDGAGAKLRRWSLRPTAQG